MPYVLTPALEMMLPARIHRARLAIEADPLTASPIYLLTADEMVALDDHLADQCAKPRAGSHADDVVCATCGAQVCEDCILTIGPVNCLDDVHRVHCTPECQAACLPCAKARNRAAELNEGRRP